MSSSWGIYNIVNSPVSYILVYYGEHAIASKPGLYIHLCREHYYELCFLKFRLLRTFAKELWPSLAPDKMKI